MTVTPNIDHAPALPLRPGQWDVDFAHSSVGFSIRHLGIAKVRGRFTSFEAHVVVGDSLETSLVTATVKLSSVDTDNADRDAHILTTEMVDVVSRPTMTFTSNAITAVDDRWVIDGTLAIGDDARPLRLDVELGGLADFPLGGPRHAGITATGEIRRSDFAIAPAFPAPILGDVIKIELDLELLEPDA